MHPAHAFFLHAGFVGFSLVILGFLLFVPFYRTFIGWVLFGVNVNFWLILFLAVGVLDGWFGRTGITADTLRSILYPSTAVCGFTLFGLMLHAQITNRKNRGLGTSLLSRRS